MAGVVKTSVLASRVAVPLATPGKGVTSERKAVKRIRARMALRVSKVKVLIHAYARPAILAGTATRRYTNAIQIRVKTVSSYTFFESTKNYLGPKSDLKFLKS